MIVSPFIKANRVNIDADGELNILVSQKIHIPRNTKPIKNGKIPTIARKTTGKAASNVRLIKVYCDALSTYLENDTHVSMHPNPRKTSAVVMVYTLLII